MCTQCKRRGNYAVVFFPGILLSRNPKYLKQRQNVYLRLAATRDDGDGPTFLALGSNHYMNVFGDAPWEADGRETNTDTFLRN